jgi:methylenetetrahydrofolate dehydrogenase (NADP+) / methenyltetrahydrofolate cyclohydrolase
MDKIYGSDLIDGLSRSLRGSVHRTQKKLGAPLQVGLIHDDSVSSRFFGEREAEALRGLGIAVRSNQLAQPSAATLRDAIAEFNDDPAITGFLFHWPMEGLTQSLFSFTELIDPSKDIDGLRPLSRLEPSGAELAPGFIMALDRLVAENEIELKGVDACVVGRSDFVGRPLAAYLLAKGATVTVCHRQTRDLSRHTRAAQVLVTATGHPDLIGPAQVSAGTVVIDVGTTVVKRNGTLGLLGDVNTKGLEAKTGRLVPVPGGIGSLVPFMIAANAVKAASAGAGLRHDHPGSAKAAS